MEVIQQICSLVEEHQSWRRSCLNMIASESVTSPLVEAILASDLSRRYFGTAYSGIKVFAKLFELTTELAKAVFGVKYADVRPVTGNVAGLSVVTSLTQPGDTIITSPGEYGGYPLGITGWANIQLLSHPFDPERYNIEVEAATKQIRDTKPALVVVGMSEYLFPHPVQQIAEAAHDVGANVWYDGAHVMGLIAGGQFQDPFAEGADVMSGSTHKTLPGPQRGIVLTNNDEVRDRLNEVLGHEPVFLLSCIHNNTVAALAVALAEFQVYGKPYAKQVVANAQALGKRLDENGVELFGAKYGITRSHQVLIRTSAFGSEEAVKIQGRLEEAGIISDCIPRLGTQELTRLGMKEEEMRQIGAYVADVVLKRRPLSEIREDTRSLALSYQTIHYSFQDGEQAYALIGKLL